MILLAMAFPTEVSLADAKLSKQKGCASCHGGVRGVAINQEAHAPPVKEIAAKYRDQPNAESDMVKKMSDLNKHPEVKVSDAERRTLVRFFLTY